MTSLTIFSGVYRLTNQFDKVIPFFMFSVFLGAFCILAVQSKRVQLLHVVNIFVERFGRGGHR